MSRASLVTMRLATTSLLVLAALGCGSATPPPQPASFERPGRVAFACFQTNGSSGPRPVAFAKCVNEDSEGENKPNLSMHAIVTQTSHGEVAAVDLEKRRILDSRNDIPGYTFLPVGELPSAVVVPRNHPDLTYVSNFGSRDITVLRTKAFRKLGVGETATLQTVPVTLPGAGGTTREAPVDMVITPDEDALLLALPDAHAVLRMPIRRCPKVAASTDEDAGATGADAAVSCIDGELDAAAATLLPLDKSLGLATVPAAKGVDDEAYRLACLPDDLLSAPKEVALTLPAGTSKSAPEPVAFAIDAFCKTDTTCTRRLLIADRALPFVHAVDLDALASGDTAGSMLAPIVTGVPTSAVAVTPRVPKALGEAKGETQYVYAIDGTDGSVIVTQNGKVLSVSADPAGRRDRIALGNAQLAGEPRAVSLAVVTPAFDVHGDAAQYALDETMYGSGKTDGGLPALPAGAQTCLDSEHTTRSQARLRGVFLAVGVSDGTVRIVDVHDMELAACRNCGTPTIMDPYPVVRHRTRIAIGLDETATETPRIVPDVTPILTVDGESFVVNVDGTTNSPRGAGLSCMSCDAPQVSAFPDPRDLASATDAGLSPLDGGVDAAALELDAAVRDAAISSGAADAGKPDAGASSASDAGVPSGDPDRPGVGARCEEGKARVCALADPWATLSNWSATFEATLPGAHGGHGRFIPPGSAENRSGQLEFASEITFCGLGVLGDEDMPADEHHVGDQLVITSVLPALDAADTESMAKLRDQCETLVAERKSGDASIAFGIKRAFDDRLVLDGSLLVPTPNDLKLDRGTPRDYTLVAQCFQNMLMTFEVRTRNAYVVLGKDPISFQHRVIANGSGRCQVDAKQSPLLSGVAYEDVPFRNAFVAFRIASLRNASGAVLRTRPGTTLGLALSSNTPKLVLDATSTTYDRLHGVLPVDLRYNDVDQTLYMVDMSARGLITIPLDGFPAAIGSSYE